MNLQMERIHSACEILKLNTLAVEWSGMADRAASKGTTLSDFLEQLLNWSLMPENSEHAKRC